MGCDKYTVEVPQSWSSREPKKPPFLPVTVMFSEDGGNCLCTFPHNNKRSDGTFDVGVRDVESLAMLGAAVVLAHHGIIPPDGEMDWGVQSIESVVPSWLQRSIKAALLERKP